MLDSAMVLSPTPPAATAPTAALPPVIMPMPVAEVATERSLDPCLGPDEGLITLAQAARHLPKIDGKKVAIPTIWRWCRRGLRGARLEYVRVGRKICTSREALMRFFAELSALDRQILPPGPPKSLGRRPISSRQRQRSLADADRVLRDAKI